MVHPSNNSNNSNDVKNLNTASVMVHPKCSYNERLYCRYLNTASVMVHLFLTVPFMVDFCQFKYSFCYGSSLKHELGHALCNTFKYSFCYGSSQFDTSTPMGRANLNTASVMVHP